MDLATALLEASRECGVPVQINRVGSMMTLFFTDTPVRDLVTATNSDTSRYARFFHSMLDSGVYFPPSQFEAWFVSIFHSPRDVEKTLFTARNALELVSR
jgi:glutamate-1-semialdehyde 2,1-aminomutase